MGRIGLLCRRATILNDVKVKVLMESVCRSQGLNFDVSLDHVVYVLDSKGKSMLWT